MASDVLRSPVSRRTGIALWRQIADAIRAGISSGLGDEAGKLPPETELAELFGVNRHTVRSAISALVQEGILRAEQGRGTFIIEPKRITYPIGKRTRFSTGLAGQGQQGSNRLLTDEIAEANVEVASALGLEVGAPVFRVRTIGTGDEVPLSRSTHFFDATRFPDFCEHYRSLQSVTKTFAACGIDDYVRKSTLVEAYHATIDDIEMLHLVPNAIVLVTHAINEDMDGNPIEYSKTRFSADRVNLHIELDALA
ncbi:phosphonate metabolism transcriptional regulator PhnF [uncultured Cohaesibacter sp.]|uniref:phosphonate metabolism transcriptional regulator PhnF n=1 Tax=uncultured Cohaesibacter sp. TaxID=1002546 RepID=UPI0029C6A887|nr:phosphonate metabolism transcriptional regulator PhnF [uncultured Cohaesibacter sp.]